MRTLTWNIVVYNTICALAVLLGTEAHATDTVYQLTAVKNSPVPLSVIDFRSCKYPGSTPMSVCSTPTTQTQISCTKTITNLTLACRGFEEPKMHMYRCGADTKNSILCVNSACRVKLTCTRSM